MAGYSDAVTVCYSGEYASQGARAECVRLAAEAFKSEVDNWSPKKFYLGAWWLLLLAIVVFPLIVYGFCLGLAAVSLWVWRGFGANAALG